MDDFRPREFDETVNVDHPVLIGKPSAPFFLVEKDGTCQFQGRQIGVNPLVHQALLRTVFWLEDIDDKNLPILGNAPTGYAATCTVDGLIGLELVLPHTPNSFGEPFNRVLIGPNGCFRGMSERPLSDQELWSVLLEWAHAGVN